MSLGSGIDFASDPLNVTFNPGEIKKTIIVEVMFNQSTYVINEETGLLLPTLILSQSLHVPFEVTISLINTTTGSYI